MTTTAKDFKVKNGLQVSQGGSFGGAVTVGTPSSDAHATTKTYVDGKFNNTTLTGTVSLPATTSIGDVSSTELSYLDGVTSAIQTQLNAKASSTHTHAQSDITNLTTDLAAKANLSGATFTGAISATNLTLSGDLTVNGTTTNINTQNLVVEDKNIIIGDVATPSNITADGGGITLKGATDKTINWVSTTNAWTMSEDLNLLTGKVYEINGTPVLSSTQVLGKSVPTGDIVGTSDSQTLTGKSLTAPRITTGSHIADANGNELIIFPTAVASAVNEVTVSNAAASGTPSITASGNDTNISLNLVAKGSGTVQAGGVPVVTTTGSQTLTNKTLTTPIISSISNTGTLTLPTSTDTLVGRATTDTLTNKSLTAPRITTASHIADANGNELIVFPTAVASAVNEVTVSNAAASGTPSITASGNDTNISLNLVAKGSGTVQAGGVPVVTTTGSQTLTNKSLTSPTLTGTVALPSTTTITSPTAAGSTGIRNMTISTAQPTGGADGDVWLVYV